MKNWVEELNYYGILRKPCFFIIDFQGNIGKVYSLDNIERSNIFFDFSGKNNSKNTVSFPKIVSQPIDFKDFSKSFEIVMKSIEKGTSHLVNLTFATPLQPIDLQLVYQESYAKYKVLYKDKWVCFSPETFIKINADNQVSTYPMKGTIDATRPNAEQELLQNPKEIEEHRDVVELLCHDLRLISDNVRVINFRYTERIKRKRGDIIQTSSEICGNLPTNWQNSLGDLLKKILPAGSISGAPKAETLEVIHLAENYQRGFYTGIAGVFDGNTLDTCVLIRFIERIGNQYFYKSGGGITSQSNAQTEYDEIQQKIYIPTC